MKVLHSLVSQDTANWLQELVILIDPCINPDGRDRYVNWYKQARNLKPNVENESYEHREPWPGGRYNHYLFDLNRDWCWQSQVESQQRAKLYHQWMPQVHVDFHEMGPNSPYYFGPAARPYHEVITDWQREFQKLTGRNHARYFDEKGWLYFTKETFDLFYPSYGDTWPTFQGAIGFTYEQGGSGRAGLALKIASGDTLTLSARMAHHFTTSLSTIEAAYQNRERLLEEFNAYFTNAQQDPPGPYRSFLIKASNPDKRVAHLLKLLDQNQIRYGVVAETGKSMRGFGYQAGEEVSYQPQVGDVLVSAYQPQANLVKVLFEPQAQLEDSLTYDLTAWSLPYAYDLDVMAFPGKLSLRATGTVASFQPNQPSTNKPLAYLLPWEDVADVRFLAALQQAKLKARYSTHPFSLNGRRFERGTLLVTRADNARADFDEKVLEIANEQEQVLTLATTGFTDDGKDFGSNSVQFIRQPKIALVNGPGVIATSFGELWHYFEQELDYPVTVLHSSYLKGISLAAYDVVILPSGSYTKFQDQLMMYTQQGGKLILLERAVTGFGQAEAGAKAKTLLGKAWQGEQKKQQEAETAREKIKGREGLFQRFEDRERARLSNFVAGSIYPVRLDPTHPLGFGLDSTYFVMKRNNTPYPLLPKEASNVGSIQVPMPVSGFTGSKLREKLNNSLVIGVEKVGKGQLVYLIDSPIFRGFWHSGKLLLGNAVFLL
jgi:hypothetical protein